jgi:hypothetical protein
MVPLVYSLGYDITAFGLERLLPFDSRKYRRIRDWLVRQGLRRPRDFVAPRPSMYADLLRVHAPDYLRSLRDRRILARFLEVPVVRYLPAWLIAWRVLRPMRWATGGAVLACRSYTGSVRWTTAPGAARQAGNPFLISGHRTDRSLLRPIGPKLARLRRKELHPPSLSHRLRRRGRSGRNLSGPFRGRARGGSAGSHPGGGQASFG